MVSLDIAGLQAGRSVMSEIATTHRLQYRMDLSEDFGLWGDSVLFNEAI
jgi:hypothetical protein